MTVENKLRLAVVSDLHVFDGEIDKDRPPSHWNVARDSFINDSSPLPDLLDLIANKSIAADVLLCGGDMADKADPAALIAAWEGLHELKRALNASDLFATVGNHDVDSRFQQVGEKNKTDQFDIDPVGILQSLRPSFPMSSEALCDRYWARKYAISECEDWRLLNINSSAFHGYSPNPLDPEFNNGRVSSFTVENIRSELRDLDRKPLNIALFHHHPTRFNNLDSTWQDYSEMIGGERLLEVLAESNQEWLIIHGHKHRARLMRHSGGADAPIIMTAGSFSARAGSGDHFSNQFYILDFDLKAIEDMHALRGKIRSWAWAGQGWEESLWGNTIPNGSGFGARISPRSTAKDIYEKYRALPSVKWAQVKQDFGDIQYMLPDDVKRLLSHLEKTHGADLTTSDRDGSPISMGFGESGRE